MPETIAFIGGGNMATSLIGGLLASGHPPADVAVIEPDADKRAALTKRFDVRAAAAPAELLPQASIWVLAVKPQIVATVVGELASLAGQVRPLVISIAAGVPLAALARWLDADLPLVRSMPNTPALIGAGITALFAGEYVNDDQREAAETVLAGAGETLWVNREDDLDAVTATSGSGPAYFFAFMEAMQAAAEELGLDRDTAARLVRQTALGAARMAVESGDSPTTLRTNVTSPGGTTERALTILDEGGFDLLVAEAMRAAAGRSRELAAQIADQ
ncbi:MAG: pyrroline-5-carboxylate reductase [Phycisphaerales bacterium]